MSRKRPVCCIQCRQELRTVQGLTGHIYAVHQRPREQPQAPDPPGRTWLGSFMANTPHLFNP